MRGYLAVAMGSTNVNNQPTNQANKLMAIIVKI
jgi:hypothetical protein